MDYQLRRLILETAGAGTLSRLDALRERYRLMLAAYEASGMEREAAEVAAWSDCKADGAKALLDGWRAKRAKEA